MSADELSEARRRVAALRASAENDTSPDADEHRAHLASLAASIDEVQARDAEGLAPYTPTPIRSLGAEGS